MKAEGINLEDVKAQMTDVSANVKEMFNEAKNSFFGATKQKGDFLPHLYHRTRH